MNWLTRWNTRRKLARGRCAECQAILRDDETTGFCSDRCAEDYRNANAY